MTQDLSLYWSSPRTRDTHTLCHAFGRGDVTTCFNDLGLSRLEFEHPTWWGKSSNPSRHPRVLYSRRFQKDLCRNTFAITVLKEDNSFKNKSTFPELSFFSTRPNQPMNEFTSQINKPRKLAPTNLNYSAVCKLTICSLID